MTLTLVLSPTQQHELQAYAEREGVSVDEYALRRLFPAQTADKPQATVWQAPAPDHSAEAQRAVIHALLTLPKEEILQRNAASIARLEAQIAEAENATPEQITRANAEWEDHKRRMNAHRALAGEQPVYADVSPSGT